MAKKQVTKTPNRTRAAETSGRSTKKAKQNEKNGRPRRVASGDTAPARTKQGIEQFVVSESIQAAQAAKVAAVSAADVDFVVAISHRGEAEPLAVG